MTRLPWFLGTSGTIPSWGAFPFGFLIIWSLIWTGLALWYAARRNEQWWFILFLFVHTAGVLELVYLIFIAHAFGSNKPSASKRK